MIDLLQAIHSKELGLFLKNDEIIIEKSIEQPLLINNAQKIVVKDGVQVMLVDTSSAVEQKIIVCPNAKVDYQILNSHHTNRLFECYGDLTISEICLDETEESLKVELLEKDSQVKVNLLSILWHQQATFKQAIHHLCPNAASNISNFGVAFEESTILFDTTGKIEKGMAKSVCQQLSKGIVMDNASVITSRPILLIDEYDVIANHGASIGKMSDDILFYLMSRGLSKAEAFLLILEGMIAPFIATIPEDALKQEIQNKLQVLMKR